MTLIRFLITLARERKKQQRFHKLLVETVGQAATWSSRTAPVEIAREQIQRLQTAPAVQLRKGAPDLVQIKKDLAGQLEQMLANPGEVSTALELAEKIASIDPRDQQAYLLYLAVFWLQNEAVILALKRMAAPTLALHMTCKPRLSRADESIASFRHSNPVLMRHIKLIGNGCHYRFDETSCTLEVPAEDTYDHLPYKVVCAYAILAISGAFPVIVKLDDDHRLGNESILKRLMGAARTSHPVQLGHLYITPFPAGHSRAWHFGKCPNKAVNDKPLSFPTPITWASGEYGYLINQASAMRFNWAHLYYRDWLLQILYEDIALGEIASKTWIRCEHVDLSAALNAKEDY
jgi:hypothetical protein